MNTSNKKNTVLFGSIFTIIFVLSYLIRSADFCYWRSLCSSVFGLVFIYSLVSVPFFVFSVITYKIKESTFISWRNFSIWWIPLSFVIITMFPTDTHGMDFFPVIKGTVSLLLTSLYSVISLAILVYKSFKKD